MKIGVPKETYRGERRVALVPGVIASLKAKGADVLVESGAGTAAGFTDAAYAEKGAQIVPRQQLFAESDVVVQIRAGDDLAGLRSGQAVIAFLDPLGAPQTMRKLAGTGATALSIELMPRITRAQSMDALSSQATVAGYKAVLLAAEKLPRMFPMLMTAAGTITPARVFVLGAGVAGLQAIATAKRLGAVIEAYDVRPAVKEQVQSVGAKFVELPLDTSAAEGSGGYAAAQDESFYRRQREVLGKVVAGTDVVITTAAIPGQKSPVLITREMVESMAPGSVIVDLAAERGGNCEVTKADEVVELNGVTVLGPTNLPATVPYHASQMYAKNVSTFLLHLLKDGNLAVDTADEITRETLVTQGGEVVHERVKKLLADSAGERIMETFISALTIFVLAVFVGVFVIKRVPPLLHTPLMSGSNAISGITIVGAMIAIATPSPLSTIFGFIAVVFATINVVGGFLVTNRMLGMFRKKE